MLDTYIDSRYLCMFYLDVFIYLSSGTSAFGLSVGTGLTPASLISATRRGSIPAHP